MTTLLNKKYFTISQASKLLGISKSTIRRWEKADKISSIVDRYGTHLYLAETLKKLKPGSLAHHHTQSTSNYVTVSMAARLVGVSKSTLLRWESADLIKSIRTHGGARRYNVLDLQSLANTRTTYQRIPKREETISTPTDELPIGAFCPLPLHTAVITPVEPISKQIVSLPTNTYPSTYDQHQKPPRSSWWYGLLIALLFLLFGVTLTLQIISIRTGSQRGLPSRAIEIPGKDTSKTSQETKTVPTGLVGIQGGTGASGLLGATGITGGQGPTGNTGASGVAGATGATGTQGVSGPTG